MNYPTEEYLQQKGKTNNSVKAEYKMESVRLVQIKDRPSFSLLWGKKYGFYAKTRKNQLRNRRIYAII